MSTPGLTIVVCAGDNTGMSADLPQLEFVSWEQFHSLSFDLVMKINHRQFDTIVSISRGGHAISRILSDFLDLPLFNVSIQSYSALKQGEIALTQKLGKYLGDHRVLLVDEIVDSGKTLARAQQYLKRLRAKHVFSVALYVKSHAHPKPDLCAKTTDNWVVFPYEVRETVEALTPIWQKAGVPLSDLRKKLIAGGINQAFVDFFLPEK